MHVKGGRGGRERQKDRERGGGGGREEGERKREGGRGGGGKEGGRKNADINNYNLYKY